jgi:hypothetical protein
MALKQFTAIILVLLSSTLMLNPFLSPAPVGASSEDWKTAYTVGRFVNNEPAKPDQIFKIQYRIVNGTVENFRAPSEIIAEVNANGSGVLEVKWSRNYPYTNEISNTGGPPVLFIDGQTFDTDYIMTECFFVFSIPFDDSSEIGLVWSYELTGNPHHGDNVPESCIDQTVVKDVSVKKNGTIRPLYQVKAGVIPEDVLCPEGMEVFVRATDDKPYCVTPPVAEKLIELGWQRKG